ncbi:GIY-YIG nuclease family protein [Vibrio vulnificus]|uniref:GIY-YIG nuclease family protein n=1 Tax=Vibrio vulnificus TaxID=672 RepID=UPI0032424757
MSVYLSIGKDKDGNYQHIDDQISGRGALFCPFCGCPLIAAKGRQKAAHFRHDGETCKESLNEIPSIPGWHHFHLDYPLEVVEALKAGFDLDGEHPNVYQKWNSGDHFIPNPYRDELLELNNWSLQLEGTLKARIILGSLTLVRFADWMREQLRERIQSLQWDVEHDRAHQALFEIEASRQQAILNATLYLFEYQLADGRLIHKVGRTTRQPAERLSETVYDLERAIQQKVTKSKVLRQVPQCGHVEQYVFHRFSQFKAEVGDHTEYLRLDDKTARKLKADFTKLANGIKPLNKAERFIVTGRWRYEEKRLAASKRGIALTQREGGKFGRPEGTTLSNDKLLEKHADIVLALKNGLSINAAAKRTGKGRSTVQRVKAALTD